MVIYTCECLDCGRKFDVAEGDANTCPDCGYFGKQLYLQDDSELGEDQNVPDVNDGQFPW